MFHAVLAEGLLEVGRSSAELRAHPCAPEEQIRGFAFQNVEVLFFGQVDGAAAGELEDHAFDHAQRDLGDDFQDLEAPHLDREPDGADVEKVTEENREVIPEQRVDGLLAAPHHRLVDDVVVNERRGVDELRDRAVRRPLRSLVAACTRREQHQSGAHALTAATVNVAARRLHELELALHLVANDLLDSIEVGLDLRKKCPRWTTRAREAEDEFLANP